MRFEFIFNSCMSAVTVTVKCNVLFQAVEKVYSPQRKWIPMRSSFNIRFQPGINVLSLVIDEYGFINEEGWKFTPCCVPLQVMYCILVNLYYTELSIMQ